MTTNAIPAEISLGIDVGTQSVRCVATDHTGTILATGSHPLHSHRDGNRHEQDPHQWWTALTHATRQVTAVLGDQPVLGVALCATSGTILLTDTTGNPLTPGLMYDDGRATAEALRASHAGTSLWDRLGYRPQPSWALPKLLRLLATTRGPAALAHQADFLTGKLTGTITPADSSNALKTGYDLDTEQWPHELLAALDVPPDTLPTVVRPGTTVGTIPADSPTGIPAGTPVVAGMTDGCAALVGSGTIDTGSWNTVLGTTLVVKGVTPQRLHDPLGVVYSHRHPDGLWLPGGASSVGAGALTAHFGDHDLTQLDAQAAARPHTTLATYPLVSPGERFPFAAPDAHAITTGRPRDHLDDYLAILRGVAFTERLCFDYLDLLGAPTHGTLRLTGGATRSRYWNQLRADTLGRPVHVPHDADPAAGMALLARANGRPLTDAARHHTHHHDTYLPNPDHQDVLAQGYRTLVDALHRHGWLPTELADHATARSHP
ncbi:carbohydrate kinase [Actinophytocola xinjiangensis]|uniref:Carbohydrate kinase n=1 Tax=Actinophytocola xinjiangensis TaxID=485602 RepID=A0A7Z0WSW7_9PSEU|nr:FGGY family carbohydrate kinase [Actinophytocola xinjiangensis]OLF14147.1 carbohydrate kinase [Actinophytocola xinjiangensis]